MKITDLRIRELDGVMEHPDPLWEERVLRPIDIYPSFRSDGRATRTAWVMADTRCARSS